MHSYEKVINYLAQKIYVIFYISLSTGQVLNWFMIFEIKKMQPMNQENKKKTLKVC